MAFRYHILLFNILQLCGVEIRRHPLHLHSIFLKAPLVKWISDYILYGERRKTWGQYSLLMRKLAAKYWLLLAGIIADFTLKFLRIYCERVLWIECASNVITTQRVHRETLGARQKKCLNAFLAVHSALSKIF